MTKGRKSRKNRKEQCSKTKQENETKHDDQQQQHCQRYSFETTFDVGQIDEIKKYLGIDETNGVPLIVGAVVVGQVELVKKLIKDGHQVNVTGPNKLTPLMVAVKTHNMEMIDVICSRNADVDCVDQSGDNIFFLAAKNSSWDETEFVKLWNRYKSKTSFDVNRTNSAGNTILHFAVKRQWCQFVDVLLDCETNVNCANAKGVTPLMISSGRNDARLVTSLLRVSADITVEDMRGCTALCYSIAYVVAKRLSTTNRALELLVAEINGRQFTIDDYLDRRLELIATPPEVDDVDRAHTLETIVKPVLTFFVRHVQSGFDVLLELNFFGRMKEAVAKHIEQPVYLKEIFGCVFEVTRYCECCVNGGHPSIAETELVERFVVSGLLDILLDVLLRYRSSNESNLLETVLLLIFVACDVEGKTRSWLDEHYDDILPFYQKFISLSSVTYSSFCDEYHTQMVKQKVDRFHKLMSDLGTNRRDVINESDTRDKSVPKPIGYERKKVPDSKSIEVDSNQITKANSKRMRRKTKAWKAKVAKIRSADMAERIMQKPDGGGLSTNDIVVNVPQEKDHNTERTEERRDIEKESQPTINEDKPLGHAVDWPTESAWELMKKLESTWKRSKHKDETHVKTSNETTKISESKTESSSEDVYSDAESDPNSGQRQMDGDAPNDVRTETVREYCIPDVKLENVVEPTIEFLTNIFEDIVNRYEYFWQCDREAGHPDFDSTATMTTTTTTTTTTTEGPSPFFCGTREEQIEQLEQFLPRMEQEYLYRLRQKFDQVIVKIKYLASVEDSEYYSLVEQIKNALLNHEIRGETVLTRHCYSELFENILPDEYWNTYLNRDEYNKDDDRRIRQEKEYLFQVAEIVRGKKPVDEETRAAVQKKTEDNAYHLISSIEKMVDTGSSTSEESSENGFDDLFPYTNEFSTSVGESDKSSDSTPKKILLNKYRNKSKDGQDVASNTGFFHILTNKKNKAGKNVPPKDCGTKSASFFDIFNGAEQSKSNQQIPSNFWQTLNVASQSQPYVSRWDLLISTLNNCTNLTVLAGGELRTSPTSWRSSFLISSGGSFGDVELGLNIHGRSLAVKRIPKKNDTVCKIIEAAIAPLLTLRHKHLLHYSICESDDTYLYVSSPLCELNMGEYLMCSKTNISFMPSVTNVVRQILFGLRFLHDHSNPIVHGNLKPSNVLIDSKGIVKLAEFGVFRALYHTASPPNSSTIWFARETFESYKKSSLMSCTTYSDIQVTGMLLHFVLTGGFHPFGILTDEILDNVIRGVTFLKVVGCELIDLISWMLVYEPSERPSISQVLSHVYFWDDDRKWRLLLLCAGITQNGSQVTIPIGQLHINLDTTASRNNVKGDWVSIIKMKFPGIRTPDEFSDTLSGVLRFLRKCMEDKQICGTACNSIELQIFFLGAFPALPISLFRLLDMTGWLKNPIFKQFTVPIS